MSSVLNFAKRTFGPGNIKNLETFRIRFLKKYKIVVFSPTGYADKISEAMSKAGAGVIGEYTECSFRTEGKGVFRGGEKSRPVIGKKGRLEKVGETRLEMICEREKLDAVIEAMLKVHPYEEPAYDVYEILSGIKLKTPYALKLSLRKTATMGKILRKLNGQIDASIFPADFMKEEVADIIVDFSDDNSLANRIMSTSAKTLYISRILNGSINIRLLEPGSK